MDAVPVVVLAQDESGSIELTVVLKTVMATSVAIVTAEKTVATNVLRAREILFVKEELLLMLEGTSEAVETVTVVSLAEGASSDEAFGVASATQLFLSTWSFFFN